MLLLLLYIESLLSVLVGLLYAARRLWRRAALCWYLRTPSHICWNCDASRRHARWWCLQWKVGLAQSAVGAHLLHRLSRWVSDHSATMLAAPVSSCAIAPLVDCYLYHYALAKPLERTITPHAAVRVCVY